MSMYTWRKTTDKQDYPQGLHDLIQSAMILVHNGAEYAGIFVHSEDRCWLGWRAHNGESRSKIFDDPDEALRVAEAMMREGLILPRRRSRF